MKSECQRAFRGGGFWLATMAMFACLLCFSLPTWIIRCGQGDREYLSALDLSLAPVFFGGSMLMLPFCAVIAYAVSQVEDLRSGLLPFLLIRSSLAAYALRKAAAAALAAFLALFCASAAHSLLWNWVAGPYDLLRRPDVEIAFVPGSIYAQLAQYPFAFPAYLHLSLGMGITAAGWALLGLCCAMWFQDRLLCISLPVIGYYFWWCRMISSLLGFSFPRPAALYNDGQTWGSWAGALGVYALLSGLCFLAYWHSLGKKVRA